MENIEKIRGDPVNIYHTWIYEHILNTRWMVWGIVATVFLANLLGPIHIWFVMNSKSMPFKKKEQERPTKKEVTE
ncbi:hypothetical protein [Litchfieldia salsa]|uniref:Uncharacterized protein n=1 Tax=Litchfieldia salsa TaxID=930152 RepID=A0A1H0WHF4_9BACI|nr:hypothetical protein [Litchfieldia salsa]SDP90154.1 hypothetical protein SAMN05216565_111115 [Litchfieldia salsa]